MLASAQKETVILIIKAKAYLSRTVPLIGAATYSVMFLRANIKIFMHISFKIFFLIN